MLKSGEKCLESGYYRCNVHIQSYVFIEKGDKCPECPLGPYGYHATLWGRARKVSHIVAELKLSQVSP